MNPLVKRRAHDHGARGRLSLEQLRRQRGVRPACDKGRRRARGAQARSHGARLRRSGAHPPRRRRSRLRAGPQRRPHPARPGARGAGSVAGPVRARPGGADPVPHAAAGVAGAPPGRLDGCTRRAPEQARPVPGDGRAAHQGTGPGVEMPPTADPCAPGWRRCQKCMPWPERQVRIGHQGRQPEDLLDRGADAALGVDGKRVAVHGVGEQHEATSCALWTRGIVERSCPLRQACLLRSSPPRSVALRF